MARRQSPPPAPASRPDFELPEGLARPLASRLGSAAPRSPRERAGREAS